MLGVVVGILRTFLLNSHNGPLMCTLTAGEGWSLGAELSQGLGWFVSDFTPDFAHHTASSGLGGAEAGFCRNIKPAVPSPDLSRVVFLTQWGT